LRERFRLLPRSEYPGTENVTFTAWPESRSGTQVMSVVFAQSRYREYAVATLELKESERFPVWRIEKFESDEFSERRRYCELREDARPDVSKEEREELKNDE
jgi:hypothetical protein